jgi:hypothetical protein
MPFDIDLTRKVGPLPMWSWFMIAGGIGLVIFKVLGGKKAGAPTTGGKTGAGSQFSSTNTKTGTDEQGNQFSQSYSATGDGFLPGQLTYGASPMPFSSGDVYVNYPAPNNTNPDQSGPPAGSREVTLSRDSWIQDIVHDYLPVAGWGKPNPAFPSQPDAVWNPNAPYDIWSGAVESYALMQANPQIDWSHQLSKGTKLYIPPAVGAQKTVQSVTK